MTDKNPFAFLNTLPDAEMTGEVEKSDGINFQGTWSGPHALANVLYGDKVPQRTYTLGLSGRGTLVCDEEGFRSLLSSMLALFEVQRPGFHAPKPTSPSAVLPQLPGFMGPDAA